jgi:hypothetical protein
MFPTEVIISSIPESSFDDPQNIIDRLLIDMSQLSAENRQLKTDLTRVQNENLDLYEKLKAFKLIAEEPAIKINFDPTPDTQIPKKGWFW